MGRWLMAITIIIYLAVSPTKALGGEKIQERRYPIEPTFWVYKTQEEIAWELLRYALENIPSLKLRITHYEDLLEAYRRALNVVKEPKEPIPAYPERED
ncbi:MAG: hypothetical protein AB1478_07380 [Nitrospirota bacterium]